MLSILLNHKLISQESSSHSIQDISFHDNSEVITLMNNEEESFNNNDITIDNDTTHHKTVCYTNLI